MFVILLQKSFFMTASKVFWLWNYPYYNVNWNICILKGDLFSNVKKSVSELLVARSWQSSDSYQNRVPADKCHMTVSRS